MKHTTMLNLKIGFICLLSLLPNLILAEVISLKTGEKIEGKIIERNADWVKIDFHGSILPYRIAEIHGIDNELLEQEKQDIQNNPQGTLPSENYQQIDIANKFKSTLEWLLRESTLDESFASIGLKNAVTELKRLIQEYPKNSWTDDAQFLIATFSVREPLIDQAKEWENVIYYHPDTQLEEWTREKFSAFVPKVNIDLFARIPLCVIYKKLGQKEKLNNLCTESMRKFPNNAQGFQQIKNNP